MLRNVNDLYGFSVLAGDGPIGKVRDCYFDDVTWTVRFIVVETGPGLGGRKVLISPLGIHGVDWAGQTLAASMTLAQVKASPDVDTRKPVSRQHEVEQFAYYGYPYYWGDAQLWGGGPRPGTSLRGYASSGLPNEPRATASFVDAQLKLHQDRGDDPHLRSCSAVEKYHLHAIDGDIGHVESFLVDDEAWAIRYLVVNTSDWWLGHQTLIAPSWIADISWLDATVSVDLTRQSIKAAPTFDPTALPNREQERKLFDHFGRQDHQNATVAQPGG